MNVVAGWRRYNSVNDDTSAKAPTVGRTSPVYFWMAWLICMDVPTVQSQYMLDSLSVTSERPGPAENVRARPLIKDNFTFRLCVMLVGTGQVLFWTGPEVILRPSDLPAYPLMR
jgi:hypothetical protein